MSNGFSGKLEIVKSVESSHREGVAVFYLELEYKDGILVNTKDLGSRHISPNDLVSDWHRWEHR